MRKNLLFSAALAFALLFAGNGFAEILPASGEDMPAALSETPGETPDSVPVPEGEGPAAVYTGPALESRDIVLAEPVNPDSGTRENGALVELIRPEGENGGNGVQSSGDLVELIVPEQPVSLVMPTDPVTPVEPVTPVTPTDPATPADPVIPVTPTDPATPADPVIPVTPTDPVTPAEPVTPVTPTDPVTPVEPVTPVTPTDPVTPVEPVTLVTPTDPVTPTEPVTPVTPTDPVTPVEPVTPVTPAESTDPDAPVTPDSSEEGGAVAPKLMSFVTRDIKGPGKKGSISGSVAVASGHNVLVQLTGESVSRVAVLNETNNTFEFDDLDAGVYTLKITDVNTGLSLEMKQTVSEGSPDIPTAITGLAAKAEPNRIIVTGKAEPHRAVVVGTEFATQESTVVSGSDGKFMAVLTCAAGTYKVWAQYANLKETRVMMPGTVKVEDEKIDHYPTFSRGDRYHPLIYRLQQRLKELGYYTIKVDGIYGSGTERAVRLFQQVNGIHPANGVATSHTQQVLYSHAAKPFHGIMPWPAGGTLYRSPYYQPAVVPLQQRLRSLGYYTGSADGYYGSRTQQAVRNFQKRNGLPVTGTADPATQARLYSASAVPASGGGYTPGPSTGYRLLYWGCRGEAVRRLQQALRNAGYTQVRAVDGIYGQWTYDAVRAFQRDHGLSVDGIAGRKTQNALYGTHY